MNPFKTRLQRMVREFNETLGMKRYGCNDKGPSAPTSEEKVLGARMLLEEVFEYMDAAGVQIRDAHSSSIYSTNINDYQFFDHAPVNLRECADALGDIEYITAGIENCFDFGMEAVHDEIHRSNMTKEPRSEGPLGKVTKGPNYSPPNLSAVLGAQKQVVIEAARSESSEPTVEPETTEEKVST